jgi:hypothetical protein
MAPSSPLVVKMVGMERRQLSWQRGILEHQEMNEMGDEIEQLLAAPQIVRRSRSDDAVRLLYAFYPETTVGGKWLCVVVK